MGKVHLNGKQSPAYTQPILDGTRFIDIHTNLGVSLRSGWLFSLSSVMSVHFSGSGLRSFGLLFIVLLLPLVKLIASLQSVHSGCLLLRCASRLRSATHMHNTVSAWCLDRSRKACPAYAHYTMKSRHVIIFAHAW